MTKSKNAILITNNFKINNVSEYNFCLCVYKMYHQDFSFERHGEVQKDNSLYVEVEPTPLSEQQQSHLHLFINNKLPTNTPMIKTIMFDLVNKGYIQPGKYIIHRNSSRFI